MNKFVNFLRDYSIPLIAGVFVALIWANTAPESYHTVMETELILGKDFHFLVNDIFMAFFFSIAAVEIVVSVMKGGALNPVKKAINPLFATFGGVLGPVAVYFILNHFFGAPEFARGWGIPTATDIALAWLVARVVFGAGHPAVKFLLLLAIVDDGLGLGIIAIFYPDPLHPVAPIYLLGVLGAMVLAFALKKMKVQSYLPYIFGAGTLSWVCLHYAHLHPALALVFIVPFLPHDPSEPDSSLMNFEHAFKPFVDFGLFFFGLSNAGVELSGIGALTWIVLYALIFGKVIGIWGMANIGKMLGFPLPDGMGQKELITVGVVAAMGLTVALFVSGAAFVDPVIQGAAKMGALFSGFVAILAVIVGKVFNIKKIEE
ncbi:sodium/proton antiporter, NhaA family [Desulfonispora thiosulfatigenes DSM 11270]|uniref:Na(+)/H(+) antiporter NhaA n=1 Tax=Desulfonispora thiosulfatigenes DSM 11270 TaxID=656914 RepID=A0A1W1V444_DESTI|nr:Na+/H+ antiporter NhaA [Desulfonispora thiosulfatigenes]SMB88149.1 sodium/proton antiporter, NhaA family [Desulfonispora thiosulfatigenes DSM 11270]